MKKENLQPKEKNSVWVHSAKECAYLAVFVALLIALQLVFTVIPGVELVTVMFVVYAYVMGYKRGMLAATVFSLLRQVAFGAFPKILVLYLIYFNLLTLCFGLLGQKERNIKKFLPMITLIACIGTICFTLFDNVLTPIWLGYSKRDAALYFKASLPFMIPQVICTAVSVACLFFPLSKVFYRLKKSL